MRTAVDAPGVLPLTPANYDLRRSLGYLLLCNSRAAIARAERAFSSDTDVNFSQFIALMLLREGVAGTPTELASLLGYNSGAVSRLVDQLEKAGLVERDRGARDRRVVRISITPAGQEAATALLPRLLVIWNEVLEDFEPEEYRLLTSLLEKLLARFDAEGGRRRRSIPPSGRKRAPTIALSPDAPRRAAVRA